MTVLKFIFIISFISKNFLHYYLCKKSDVTVNISGVGASMVIFWFYTKTVPDQFRTIKYLCNSLQFIWMLAIALWLL